MADPGGVPPSPPPRVGAPSCENPGSATELSFSVKSFYEKNPHQYSGSLLGRTKSEMQFSSTPRGHMKSDFVTHPSFRFLLPTLFLAWIINTGIRYHIALFDIATRFHIAHMGQMNLFHSCRQIMKVTDVDSCR